MTILTIDDAMLYSPQAHDYFTTIDRRYLSGMRSALELLAIPVPPYAVRQPAGPRSMGALGVAARYAADNPAPRPTVLPARKPAAAPAVIAAAKAHTAERLGLFKDTFG